MTEKEINRDDFLYDPFSKSLFDDLASKYSEFEALDKGKWKKWKDSICKFIVLCYDANGKLFRKYQNLMERKRLAAIIAGFKTGSNGRYSNDIETIIMLQDEILAKCVMRYIIAQGSPNIIAMVAELTVIASETFAIHTGTAKSMKNSIENIRTCTKRISELKETIYGGNELENVAKYLYENVMAEALYRPESFVKRIDNGDDLEDCNPYEKGYKVNKMKFVGDE